jgi:L-ribulose-5-phosphate 4-epimerase
MSFEEVRRDVWVHAKKMWEAGLVVASAGNISRRVDAATIAITPTSVPYEVLTEEQITVLELQTGRTIDSALQPSYELPMHAFLYRARPEIQAIVHTHAPFVTTLSVLQHALPPIIDEMALYFGGTVEVTNYAFTGTEDVGGAVLGALGDRTGVILANHGNVCVGRTLAQAMHVAITMESCARVYVQALQTGRTPHPLPDYGIAQGRRMFDERYRLG